jgi:hypothetical protein
LKQQEQIQFDIVKEINAKIESLNEKKTGLKSSYDKYFEKQIKISERLLYLIFKIYLIKSFKDFFWKILKSPKFLRQLLFRLSMSSLAIVKPC